MQNMQNQGQGQTQGQAYGQNPYQQQNGNGYGAAEPQRDTHAILNHCREVGREIEDIERPGGALDELRREQRAYLQGNDASHRGIDATSAEIMSIYRAMADRVKRIKSQPGTFGYYLCK